MQRKLSPLHRRYFEGAKAIMAEFALPVLREEPFTYAVPSAEYEAMTLAGRLRITVYDDWTATCFDRTELMAGHYFPGANTRNGKWNHHTFLDQQKRADRTAAFVDGHLAELRDYLTRAGVAPFIRRPVVITTAEVDAIGENALRDRAAMGEDFVISDFDKPAAAQWVYTDHPRINPGDEWLACFARDWLLRDPDLEALFRYRSWRGRVTA